MAVGKTDGFDEDIPGKNAARGLAGPDIHTTTTKAELDVEARRRAVERDRATTGYGSGGKVQTVSAIGLLGTKHRRR